MAKIFFTSGTGYIGLAAAKAAKEAGHSVTALSRSDESTARLQEYGIKAHKGDLRQPDTYKQVLKDFDVVVHTAAVNGADFAQVEEQTVQTILAELKGTQKAFIYTSGVWVLGNTGDKPATEETQPNPLPLVAWRPQVEQTVIAGAKDGIRTSVIRPALVYGNGGGIIGQIFAVTKQAGKAPIIGPGENRWTFIHVEDLGRLYVLAAEKAPAGSLLHGADNRPVKQREVAELIAKAADVPGQTQVHPIEEARKIFGAFADGLALDQHVDAPVTRKSLNWEPKAATIQEDLNKGAKQFATPAAK
jgi:nucleoside-diphosphate-sugar epimerase